MLRTPRFARQLHGSVMDHPPHAEDGPRLANLLIRATLLTLGGLIASGCMGHFTGEPGEPVCESVEACAALQDGEPDTAEDADDDQGDEQDDADEQSEDGEREGSATTEEQSATGGGSVTGKTGNSASGGMCESPVDRPSTSLGEGFFVLDGKIYDANGCEFIPFGFNGAVFWNIEVDGSRGQHPEAHRASFADMGATGANAVRIVTQTEGSFGWNANAETQRELVELAVDNNLVPILEMHNATCGDNPIEPIRAYWESAPMVKLAQDFESTMWINIANEANFDTPEDWRDFYAATIKSLRDRDVNNLIVLDAGDRCGQDPEAILKYGKEILAGDPNHNVAFSFHMYGFWFTEDCPRCGDWTPPFKVEEEFQALKDTGLAIYIGEFGWDVIDTQDVLYDPRIVVQTAEELGIGWTFWAWYEENPNYQTVQDLAKPDELTLAGDFLVPYIRSIAQPATHMSK